MKSLDELITYHRSRMHECLAEFEVANGQAPDEDAPTHIQEAHLARCELWAEEAVIARDTLSWLEVCKNRTFATAAASANGPSDPMATPA